MTFDPRTLPPSERSPWSQVSTQIIGDTGSDLLKPVGENTTKTKFVLVRTPDACANMANRLQGGVPHLSTTSDHAAGLLCNSVWRELNQDLAYKIVPHLMPPRPEPETVAVVKTEPIKPDGRIARLLAAAEKRGKIEAELRRDPKRSDRLICAAVGTSDRGEVREIRKRLESEGNIPRIDKAERVGIERPKRYKRQHERVAEIAAKTKAWRAKEKQ